MFKIITIFLSLTFFLSFNIHAEIDKFNTYQWTAGKKTPWFEWWYYKIVLPETKESFYFMYGIVNPWDRHNLLKGTRSSVEMGEFKSQTLIKNTFNIDQFHASNVQTLVEVAGSTATDQNIKGEVEGIDGEHSYWDISIINEWAYNAMGWMIDKDITNIKWYPAQASARCSGTIVSKGKLFQFNNAPCYQDKNWGTSFPIWWTWIVSNNFKDNPTTALAIGGGRPKYFETTFPYEGVSIGLKHKGKIYHFRPQDFDNVSVDVKFGKWEIKANNRTDKIIISAFAPKEKFMDLQFMTPTGEIFHDYETLNGDVTVKLYKRYLNGWSLIETLFSDTAGIEFGEPSSANGFKNLFKTKKNFQ